VVDGRQKPVATVIGPLTVTEQHVRVFAGGARLEVQHAVVSTNETLRRIENGSHIALNLKRGEYGRKIDLGCQPHGSKVDRHSILNFREIATGAKIVIEQDPFQPSTLRISKLRFISL
jgi:hypothetical protein